MIRQEANSYLRQRLCRLCKEEKDLKCSHIIPEFLYKPLYDAKHRAVSLSEIEIGQRRNFGKKRLIQKGLRERLLCSECEQLLNNRYEKYFKALWFDQGALPSTIESGVTFELHGLDYHKFKLFHLSVLFRAGVSSLPQFSQVKLGAHEI